MKSLTIALWITLFSLIGFGTYSAADPGFGDVQFSSQLGDDKDNDFSTP